jgi:aldehyde:ferredoxin oxidoreductase
MKMRYGYMGNILRVNLIKEEVNTEHPSELFYRTYFGGRGLIAYYLLRELEAGIDPLGPDNKLVFACGPVTGVPFSGSGRNSIGAKSPLTGAYGEAEVGGFWGAELKKAGYDAIIVEGAAKSPVYLWIRDEDIEIRDASHLTGIEIKSAEAKIKEEAGEKGTRVCQTGPGGEKLVRYACVVNDLNHVAGRCGLGAVMGSKHLRAIAVKGTKSVSMANGERVRELAKWMAKSVESNAKNLHTYGTGSYMDVYEHIGNLPINNWKGGSFPGVDNISAQAIKKQVSVGMGTCYACAVRCKKEVQVDEPWQVDAVYGGPEYETIGALGSNCGVDNLEAICKANELCQRYCIDTISTGGAISFAMECFEKGLIGIDDTGGIELRFGNAEAMVRMTEMIGKREGIGKTLGEGVMRAADILGFEGKGLAVHVKGQEVPLHEPRIKWGLGLGYAVSPTGADHQHNMHDTEFMEDVPDSIRSLGILSPLPPDDLSPAKIRMFIYAVLWFSLDNCLVTCQFPPWSTEQKVDLVRSVTGWNTSSFELMKLSERALNLTRVFNIREGFTKADDWLPAKFFETSRTGPLTDKSMEKARLKRAIEKYYKMMGWSEEGVPGEAKLEELDIGWASAELA